MRFVNFCQNKICQFVLKCPADKNMSVQLLFLPYISSMEEECFF